MDVEKIKPFTFTNIWACSQKDLPSERNTSTLEKCPITYSNYVVLVSESVMWGDNFKRQNLPTLLLQSAHTSFRLSIGKIILSKIFENGPKNKNWRQKKFEQWYISRRWGRKNHKRKFEFRLICRQEKVSFYRGNFPNLSGSNTILKLLWVGKTLPFIYMLKSRAVPLTYLSSLCFCGMSVT